MRVACLYLETSQVEPQTLRELAEACFRFTPQIALGDRAVFLEVGASQRLFSEPWLALKLGSLAKRFGLLSRITFGNSPAEAFALARYPNFTFARDLPLEALVDYAFPFGKNAETDRFELDFIPTLQLLGLKTIGDLGSLPPRSLASRFGKEAVKIDAAVRSEARCAWPGFHPASSVVEQAPVENSESLEPVLFVLRGLADRMLARLRGRGERVSVLRIRLDLVKWGSARAGLSGGKIFRREFRISLPLAQGSTAGLIPILRDYLTHRLENAPLDAPVDSVQIEVLETVPSRGAQRDFFSKKEEQAEIWDALVARLSQKLGQDRVFAARSENRYLPEKAYSRSLKRDERSGIPPAFSPPRPTRLLKNPQPLGNPASFKNLLSGPERLCGEWWLPDGEGFDRDYYHLKTASGEDLWVFIKRAGELERRETVPELYLHGYFE